MLPQEPKWCFSSLANVCQIVRGKKTEEKYKISFVFFKQWTDNYSLNAKIDSSVELVSSSLTLFCHTIKRHQSIDSSVEELWKVSMLSLYIFIYA